MSKLIRGHACYDAVRSARVNGRPRNVDQVYLGKVDDLVALRQGALTPTTVRTRRFGETALTFYRSAAEMPRDAGPAADVAPGLPASQA